MLSWLRSARRTGIYVGYADGSGGMGCTAGLLVRTATGRQQGDVCGGRGVRGDFGGRLYQRSRQSEHRLLNPAELSRRRSVWKQPAPKDERGYRRLYEDHVLQANEGCDFDFLRGRSPVVADTTTYL